MRANGDEPERIFEQQEAFDFGPPRPLVREPHPGERKALLEVIGRAFYDDPVSKYVFPKDSGRVAGFARFSGLAIDAFAESAIVLTNEAVQGAAIWQAPSPAPTGGFLQIRLAMRLAWIAGRHFPRVARLGEFMSKHHLREPHYYLATLGTDPQHQGKGIGSAVMQPILDRCDKEHLPAYLESSKEANIPFYNGHGFDVIEDLQIPDGPRLWPMIRKVR
jgi:GNAT superfamily N-acetyltransferase